MAKTKLVNQVLESQDYNEYKDFSVGKNIQSFDDYLRTGKQTGSITGKCKKYQVELFGDSSGHHDFITICNNLVSPYCGSLWDVLHGLHTFHSNQWQFEKDVDAVIIDKKIKGFKKILLINADETFTNISDCYGDQGMPMVSFSCLEEMHPGAIKLIADGQIKLVDFSTETRLPVNAGELKKAKQNTMLPNLGLTPPECGFTLVKTLTYKTTKYTWHRSGTTLFHNTVNDEFYLFGQDEGTYFGCCLAEPCKTIKQAIRSLQPKFLWKRRDISRQGEWYVVPMTDKELPAKENCLVFADNDEGNEDSTNVVLPIVTADDNYHRVQASCMRVTADKLYFKDLYMIHDEHQSVSYKGWCMVVRNTAIRSVSQEGVD
jgi:hypothetical protein